jgi:hypothetical protein
MRPASQQGNVSFSLLIELTNRKTNMVISRLVYYPASGFPLYHLVGFGGKWQENESLDRNVGLAS